MNIPFCTDKIGYDLYCRTQQSFVTAKSSLISFNKAHVELDSNYCNNQQYTRLSNDSDFKINTRQYLRSFQHETYKKIQCKHA